MFRYGLRVGRGLQRLSGPLRRCYVGSIWLKRGTRIDLVDGGGEPYESFGIVLMPVGFCAEEESRETRRREYELECIMEQKKRQGAGRNAAPDPESALAARGY